jgi:rhomboid protease GluP
MPSGFVYTTSHSSDTPLSYLSPESVVLISARVVAELGWEIVSFSNSALLANAGNEEVLIWVQWEKVGIKSKTADERAHDWGKNRKNVVAYEQRFNELRSDADEYAVVEAFEAFRNDHRSLYDESNAGAREFLKDKPGRTKGFLFRKGFVVTPSLIVINFLVFLGMVLTGADIVEPTSSHIFRWGGNLGPVTIEGQWWRLVTSQFVHIGIIHLLTNMVALLFVGMTLEPLFGKSRFLTAYLLSGVCGNLLSLYMHPDGLSAGASGCIFGLLGIFLALLSVNLTDRENRKRLFPVLAIYIVYLLAGGLKEQHVDVAAHAGGLIGGLLLGYAFLPSLNRYSDRKLKYGAILRISLVMLLVVMLFFEVIG